MGSLIGGELLGVGLLGADAPAKQYALGTWVARSVPADEWRGLVWSPVDSQFVSVGDGPTNHVMTSPDGINWTNRAASANKEWIGVDYSRTLGLYAAVAFDVATGTSQIMTSPDGINWTTRTTPAAEEWISITWAEFAGVFVAVAYQGYCMTSPDGINWTLRTIPAEFWIDVKAIPALGLIIAVGDFAIATSPDGINWTSRTPAGTYSEFGAVAYSSHAKLVAVTGAFSATSTNTSPDGTNWTARSVPQDNVWQGMTYAGHARRFVAVANTGTNRVMTSLDGVTWSAQAAAENNSWLTVEYSPQLKRLVAVAIDGTNRVMTNDLVEV